MFPADGAWGIELCCSLALFRPTAILPRWQDLQDQCLHASRMSILLPAQYMLFPRTISQMHWPSLHALKQLRGFIMQIKCINSLQVTNWLWDVSSALDLTPSLVRRRSSSVSRSSFQGRDKGGKQASGWAHASDVQRVPQRIQHSAVKVEGRSSN